MGILKNSSGKGVSDAIYINIVRQDIVKYDLHVKALIEDIKQCVGPESILNDLNLTVREKMTFLRQQIEEMERLAREQDKETDAQSLLREAVEHRRQISSNQVSLRRANVACQMVINRTNKDQLFDGGSESIMRRRQQKDKEQMIRMSSGVTDNLLSISRTLASQVDRSKDTLDVLGTSSQRMHETQEEFKGMSGTIGQSRKLLTKYGQREATDRVLIIFALAFFFACVLYIIKKRLF